MPAKSKTAPKAKVEEVDEPELVEPEVVDELELVDDSEVADEPARISGDELRARLREERRVNRLKEKGY